MNKVDSKYKIQLTGEYWAGVLSCPECGFQPDCSITVHIIGFADSNIGTMAICECPMCFTKWHFHARLNTKFNYYDMFLEGIDNGTQKHYKKQ